MKEKPQDSYQSQWKIKILTIDPGVLNALWSST